MNELEADNIVVSFQEQNLNRQKYYRPNFDGIWLTLSVNFPEYEQEVVNATG